MGSSSLIPRAWLLGAQRDKGQAPRGLGEKSRRPRVPHSRGNVARWDQVRPPAVPPPQVGR